MLPIYLMVEAATLGRLTAGLILLLGNGYFVTIEFAMTRVRQFSEKQFQGSAGLRRAWEMTEELEIYLSGCQLGITICSIGLGVVAEPALAIVVDPVIQMVGLETLLGGQGGTHSTLSVVVSFVIINLLHLVIGEQAPTYLGIERTRFIAGYGAPILYWWTRVFSPVIRTADWAAKAVLTLLGVEITRSWTDEEVEAEEERPAPESRGDVLQRMGSLLTNAGMRPDRRQEVLNAMAIDRLEVEDIMIPAEEIVALSTQRSAKANIERISGTPHTRFPLVDESIHDRVGIVYVPSLIQHWSEIQREDLTFEEVAVSPMTVSPDMAIADLIDEFQTHHQELALVVDTSGNTVGLVTVTDAFEAIAGDIEDPMDLRE